MKIKPLIGFIGQGFIGSAYSDDLESRGHSVVRYSIDEYSENKEKIAECDIVFIAVPTPTTEDGFDLGIVRSVLPLVGEGKIAVIKSTILPGSTDTLQEEFPSIFLMHSPEFLREKTAREDAANPVRNIVGVTEKSKDLGEAVLAVLPDAIYERVLPVKEAELVKYAGNVFLIMKVVYANMLSDLAESLDADYERIREALVNDPRIGESHTKVSMDGGRGAGGHCFVKDLAAFREVFEKVRGEDGCALAVLRAFEKKNVQFLCDSGKDSDIVQEVYGKCRCAKNTKGEGGCAGGGECCATMRS